MIILADIDIPIDDLKEFGQASINVEGMLVMTLFIFALSGLVFMLAKLRGGNKPTDKEQATDVIKFVIDSFGEKMDGMVSRLEAIIQADNTQSQIASDERTKTTTALEKVSENMERLSIVILSQSDQQKRHENELVKIKTDVSDTGEQVANMNGDIIEIKQAVQSLLQSNTTMIQALDSMSKNLLLILAKLEEETEAETEKLIEIPKVLEIIPKTPGVPVTPKPEAKQNKEV